MVKSMHPAQESCLEGSLEQPTSKPNRNNRDRSPSWGLQSAFPPGPKTDFESVEELAEAILPVMIAACDAAGRNCEAVLHDLSRRDLSHSVWAIYNGKVSRRTVGSPSTNLGLEALRDEAADHDQFGYTSQSSDGTLFRSSSIYYRNREGRIIAAVCFNYDLTPLQQAAGALDSLLQSNPERSAAQEVIAPDISRVLEGMIDAAIKTTGRPAPLLDKADRINVLSILERQGAFTVKRSIEQVAGRLGISRVTAYAYLDEVRRGELGPA